MGRFSSRRMNVFDEERFELEAFDDTEFDGTPETFTVFVPTDMVNLSRIPDDYDYDMETSHNTFFWDELLPTLIVYCLTFVLGLVGNVLIIFTIFRYRKMKSTTNVFLASLASSDLLLILFCIPVKDLKRLADWSHACLKNQEMTPSVSHFHSTKKIKKHKGKDVKIIHRVNYQVSNPFSTKPTLLKEPFCTKKFETSMPIETELGKLNLSETGAVSSSGSSQSEEAVCELPKDLKYYSEFIKQLRKQSRDVREYNELDKSSKSDSKILEWNLKSDKKARQIKNVDDLMYLYPFWEKIAKSIKSGKKIGTRHKGSSHKSRRKCGAKSHESDIKLLPRKCSSTSENLSCTTADSRHRKSHHKGHGHREHKSKQVCCAEYSSLKSRVKCLEKEMEQVKKIISLIKLPEAVIEGRITPESSRELKKCTCGSRPRHQQPNQKHQQKYQEKENEVRCYPVRATSLESIVGKSKSRDVQLKSSTSDCHLNVGMEIKMQNVDPITGRKLEGEINKSFQQDGNIQCRLFEEGQIPLLILDTDFQYNPRTGMLFRSKKSPNATRPSTAIALPLKTSKEPKIVAVGPSRELSKGKNLQQSFTCVQKMSDKVSQEYSGRRKCVSLEHNSLDSIGVPRCSYHKSKRSQSFESLNAKTKQRSREGESNTDSRLKAKESNARDGLMEKFPESEVTKHASHSARSKTCRQARNGKSFIPTRRKPTPSLTYRSTSGTSSLFSVAVSPKSSMHESYSPLSSNQMLAKLFSFTWTFGFVLCKLVHYMQSVSAICSVLTLTAMSLERYYAIVHPMKAQYICTISQARRIITGTWVSAFLLAVPILFAQVHLRVGVKVEAYWCVRDWDNKIVWRAHELYMFLLILIVPTGVMAVAYTAICWEIWEVMQRRQDMTSGKEQGYCKKPVRNSSTESFPSFIYTNNPSRLGNKRRGRALLRKELTDDTSSVKQVIKMLVAVLVIYVLCWGPMLIDNVLQAYGVLSHIRMGWLKYMGTAFHLMAYFNSCINPIIYGFMSKNFRDSFRKTLCCMGGKQKMALRSFSLSQTRNTSIRYAESSFSRAVSIALPV